MSDRWRDGYDNWKLRTPPEYEADDPPPSQDPGECQRCQGSGWIVCNRLGRYLGAGPLTEYVTMRGLHDAECDACGGSGTIYEPEDEDVTENDVRQAKAKIAQAARELLSVYNDDRELFRKLLPGVTEGDINTLRELATWDQKP